MLAPGLITFRSSRSVPETVAQLESALTAHGLKIFALIDHSGEAEQAGLAMPPTQVIVFGSPRAGTPLMLAAPSLAIDLPLKALVSEDSNGQTFVTLNDPAYLQSRHSFPSELLANLAGATALIQKTLAP
jgi:uncharacterized protein (DUF302 family)